MASFYFDDADAKYLYFSALMYSGTGDGKDHFFSKNDLNKYLKDEIQKWYQNNPRDENGNFSNTPSWNDILGPEDQARLIATIQNDPELGDFRLAEYGPLCGDADVYSGTARKALLVQGSEHILLNEGTAADLDWYFNQIEHRESITDYELLPPEEQSRSVLAAYDEIEAWVKKYKNPNSDSYDPNITLTITGHSKGGFISYLQAIYLYEHFGIKAKVIALDSPGVPYSFYAAHKEACDELEIKNYCHPSDVINMLGYWPEGTRLFFDAAQEDLASAHNPLHVFQTTGNTFFLCPEGQQSGLHQLLASIIASISQNDPDLANALLKVVCAFLGHYPLELTDEEINAVQRFLQAAQPFVGVLFEIGAFAGVSPLIAIPLFLFFELAAFDFAAYVDAFNEKFESNPSDKVIGYEEGISSVEGVTREYSEAARQHYLSHIPAAEDSHWWDYTNQEIYTNVADILGESFVQNTYELNQFMDRADAFCAQARNTINHVFDQVQELDRQNAEKIQETTEQLQHVQAKLSAIAQGFGG